MSSVIASMVLMGCYDTSGAAPSVSHQALGDMDTLEEIIFRVDDEEQMNQLPPDDRQEISEAIDRARDEGSDNLSVVIYNPTFDGYRVDYCVIWAQGCGLPAASVTCKLHGYRIPISYGVLWDYGLSYVLGSDRVCVGSFCDALSWVLCE